LTDENILFYEKMLILLDTCGTAKAWEEAQEAREKAKEAQERANE
jgi:hypothetical protein